MSRQQDLPPSFRQIWRVCYPDCRIGLAVDLGPGRSDSHDNGYTCALLFSDGVVEYFGIYSLFPHPKEEWTDSTPMFQKASIPAVLLNFQQNNTGQLSMF